MIIFDASSFILNSGSPNISCLKTCISWDQNPSHPSGVPPSRRSLCRQGRAIIATRQFFNFTFSNTFIYIITVGVRDMPNWYGDTSFRVFISPRPHFTQHLIGLNVYGDKAKIRGCLCDPRSVIFFLFRKQHTAFLTQLFSFLLTFID